MEIWNQFIIGIKNTSALEFIGVIAGIVSVFFSRKVNIWVYPTGLVSTIIFTYLSYKGQLLGEASVNIYYTIMSIYGWIQWAKKDNSRATALQITKSTKRELWLQILFFIAFFLVLFAILTGLKARFAPEAIPWADALSSSAAYTGMWLMAKKKIENWHWWIITNIISIPLYFVKGYVFTSFQFVILLIMAFAGLHAWRLLLQKMEKN